MNAVCAAIIGGAILSAAPAGIAGQALTVTRTRDLRFPTVLAGFPTSVSRLNNRCGRVSIRGQRNAEITAQWTLPTDLQHTTQSDLMPVSFGTDDAGYSDRQNLNTMTGWDPATTLTVRLASNNGRKHFVLGGTVSPPTTQRAGTYRGLVALTIAYTGN